MVAFHKNWTTEVSCKKRSRHMYFIGDNLLHAISELAWENSPHLPMLPLVSPPNDVWEMSAETPSILMTRHYPDMGSASVTGLIKFPPHGTTNQKHYSDLGSDTSPNVDCFLRLYLSCNICSPMLFFQYFKYSITYKGHLREVKNNK